MEEKEKNRQNGVKRVLDNFKKEILKKTYSEFKRRIEFTVMNKTDKEIALDLLKKIMEQENERK